MTYSMLASIVKISKVVRQEKKAKFGFYFEADTYCKIADELGIIRRSTPSELQVSARHPLV